MASLVSRPFYVSACASEEKKGLGKYYADRGRNVRKGVKMQSVTAICNSAR